MDDMIVHDSCFGWSFGWSVGSKYKYFDGVIVMRRKIDDCRTTRVKGNVGYVRVVHRTGANVG